MRRLFISVFLVLGLVTVPSLSHADSLLFPSRDRSYRALWAFEALCLAHRLDREGALKAAEAQGWLVLPDGEKPTVGGVDDVLQGMKAAVISARWKPSKDGDMVLLFSREAGSAVDHCTIAFHSGFRMASSVLGGSEMAPLRRFEQISPKYDLWAFVEENGRRRGVRTLSGKVDYDLIVKASAERRFAHIAVIGSDTDTASLYTYTVPPPQLQKALPPVAKPGPFSPDPAFDASICQAARDAWVAKVGPNPSVRVRGMMPNENQFLRFDSNCDQKLTLTEFVELSWYGVYDENGPGGEISYKEYIDRICPTFAHLDPEVTRRICERYWTPGFRKAKATGRNVITKDSYSRVFAVQFRKYDRNRDGVLTISKDRRPYFYD